MNEIRNVKKNKEKALLGLEKSLLTVWEDVDEAVVDFQSPLDVMMDRWMDELVEVINDSGQILVDSDKRSLVPQFLPELDGMAKLRDAILDVRMTALKSIIVNDKFGGWGVIYAQLEHLSGIPSAVLDAFELRIGEDSEILGIVPLITKEGHLSYPAYGAAIHLVDMGLYSEKMFGELPDIDPRIPRLDASNFGEH